MIQWVKNLPAMQETKETQFRSLGWEDPLEERTWQPTPVLPGKSHGWSNLMGYSPKGCKQSDMTEGTEHVCILREFPRGTAEDSGSMPGWGIKIPSPVAKSKQTNKKTVYSRHWRNQSK